MASACAIGLDHGGAPEPNGNRYSVVSAPPDFGTEISSALSSMRFVTATSPWRAVSRAIHHDASGWMRRPWPG